MTAPESIAKNNLDCAILHLDSYHRFWFYFATSVMMESSLCMVFFQSRRPFTKWVNLWGGTGSCWRSWMHHDDGFKGLWFSACFGESINLMLWWFALLSLIPGLEMIWTYKEDMDELNEQYATRLQEFQAKPVPVNNRFFQQFNQSDLRMRERS